MILKNKNGGQLALPAVRLYFLLWRL